MTTNDNRSCSGRRVGRPQRRGEQASRTTVEQLLTSLSAASAEESFDLDISIFEFPLKLVLISQTLDDVSDSGFHGQREETHNVASNDVINSNLSERRRLRVAKLSTEKET